MELSRKALEEAGFDGLYCVAGDPCGCESSDLAPCGEGPSLECKPGYKHLDPRPGREGMWAIGKDKEGITAEDFESIEPGYINSANENWNLVVPWWFAKYCWWAKYGHWCQVSFFRAIDHMMRGGKIRIGRA